MRGLTLTGQIDDAQRSLKVGQFLTNGGVTLLLISILAFSLARENLGAAQQQSAPKAETKMHRSQAGVAGKDGWYQAESTEGHFRVKMPIPFNDYTVSVVDNGGRKISVFCIGSISVEKYKFSVSELPRGPRQTKPDVLLRDYVDKSRRKGDFVSGERHFKYRGHPAVEFNVAGGQSAASLRYIITEDHDWLQIVEYPPSSRNDVESLLKPFFDSLEFTNARQPEIKKP